MRKDRFFCIKKIGRRSFGRSGVERFLDFVDGLVGGGVRGFGGLVGSVNGGVGRGLNGVLSLAGGGFNLLGHGFGRSLSGALGVIGGFLAPDRGQSAAKKKGSGNHEKLFHFGSPVGKNKTRQTPQTGCPKNTLNCQVRGL